MRLGIILAVIDMACYVVHAVLLNYYLRKNAPEVLGRAPHAPSQHRQSRVHVVEGAAPRWVTLLGLPALPLFLLGIVLIAVSFLVKMFR
jgi:hypothetical protein